MSERFAWWVFRPFRVVSGGTGGAWELLRATEILKAQGWAEIYPFGSLASGQADEGTDIDFVVLR